MTDEIARLQEQIQALTGQLNGLWEDMPTTEVRNYKLTTIEGEVSLLDMFGVREKLLLIHNMGQGVDIAPCGRIRLLSATSGIDYVCGARLQRPSRGAA